MAVIKRHNPVIGTYGLIPYLPNNISGFPLPASVLEERNLPKSYPAGIVVTVTCWDCSYSYSAGILVTVTLLKL